MSHRFLLALFLFPAIEVAAQVTAGLALDAAVTATPVPVSFKFTFTNPAAEEREVPRKAMLIVTPDGGAPFIARWRGSPVADLGVSAGIARIIVAPRGTAEFELLANPFFDSPGWFTDPRLYSAGKKELQVVFSDALDDGRELTPVADLPDRVVTTKAMLEIKAATGEDAAACAFVRDQLARDEPCPLHAMGEPALIGQVWERFPKSSYRDWLVSRVPEGDAANKIALLERAVARQRGLVLWWNLAALGRLYGNTGKSRAVYERLSTADKFFFRDLAKQRLAELDALRQAPGD